MSITNATSKLILRTRTLSNIIDLELKSLCIEQQVTPDFNFYGFAVSRSQQMAHTMSESEANESIESFNKFLESLCQTVGKIGLKNTH